MPASKKLFRQGRLKDAQIFKYFYSVVPNNKEQGIATDDGVISTVAHDDEQGVN